MIEKRTYGVFAWQGGTGRYRREEVVKVNGKPAIYKRRSAAERLASELTTEAERFDLPSRETGYVAREIF